jgi:osmoprotectant transport system ATP-binding protein
MFRLDRVSKRFGNVVALESLDLTIEPRRTTVLIGPSGSGKSTVLRLMTGLAQPDAGAVFFEDARITTDNIMRLRQRMGYVIQEGGLFPHLSAERNVTLVARYLRWPREKMAHRVNQLVQLVQLPAQSLSRYPAELSGGQRQRVSLMRALMLDPDVLLLDEPLGALDPMIRFDLQNDLRRIFQTLHKTVVIVTHDMGEAAFFGDTIVLMRDGRVVQEGTIRELIETPADPFVEKFIRAQRSPLEELEPR